MKKETIVIVLIALIVGVLVGVIFTNMKKDSVSGSQSIATTPTAEYQQKIQLLEGIVKKEPENQNAWVQLGHNYFDSDQPLLAIKAYAKALELGGNDADILTDQGIMYRRVGQFDQAIENFTKANKLNPNHFQSLYNLGIVYRFDTGELDQAKKVWSQYLEINPIGEGADQVRAMLQQI